MRTVGATLQVQGPSGHLSWADRAKQQAEGGGGRWILSALSRLNSSTRISSGKYCPALSRLGCASEERGLTDDGRPRAPTYRPPYYPAAPRMIRMHYSTCPRKAYVIMFCADAFTHQAKLGFRCAKSFAANFLIRDLPSFQLPSSSTSRDLNSFRMKVSLDSSREDPQTPGALACHSPSIELSS